MIQLPAGFDLSLFISELCTFGVSIVGVAIAFGVFHVLIRAIGQSKP